MTYKWLSPLDWLLGHISKASNARIKLIALRLAMETDADTIQDLYQNEMEADDYFGPADEKTCYHYTAQCEGSLWQCRACEEWYCQAHFHQSSVRVKTSDGVECVTCERIRLGLEN